MSPADIASAWIAGGVTSVERIKHGLTNESWLVRGAEDAVVVRISHRDTERLQINRTSEAMILDTVARAGIGPAVLLCDPARHLLVTRYLGPTWSDTDAVRDDNIERVAKLMSRLHALDAPAGAHRIDLARVVSDYLSDLDAHGQSTAGGAALQRRRAYEVAGVLEASSVPRLCHTDVHALNIVDNGELRLLDWEYAGLGEPLFDVASLCIFHCYSLQQRRLLLRSYAGRFEESTWRRLELACWLFEYVRELWLAVRSLTRQ
jgi:thiamine kinase